MSKYQPGGSEAGVPGGGGIEAYYQPLIDPDEVASADPNSLLDGPMATAWTQDGTTLHTVDVASGANSPSVDPDDMAYRIFALKDANGVAIGLDELASCEIFLNIVSGFEINDNTIVQFGIINGPDITDTRLWGYLEGGTIARRLRIGRDGTIFPAAPVAGGVINARFDFYQDFTGTAGQLQVVEHYVGGADASNVAIAQTSVVFPGTATALDGVPHIIVTVGGFVTPGPRTVSFFIDINARRHPGGVMPR